MSPRARRPSDSAELELPLFAVPERPSPAPPTDAPVPFDALTVSLEPGVSLVEASAGTGKTYSIVLAVLRLLLDRDASGAHRVGDIGRVLVVTFTNAATDELVTRVRRLLRDAVDVFEGTRARDASTESLHRLLERYGAASATRLREALSMLDRLSVFTIHGFCKRVLEESALESGTPYDAGFIEDDAQIAARAAQDWWRRTMYGDARLAGVAVHDWLTTEHMLGLWRQWRRHPDTRIEPAPSIAGALLELDAAHRRFADAWDRERAAEFFEARSWLSGGALSRVAFRQRIVGLGEALARGDLAHAAMIAEHCCTERLLHKDKGTFKRPAELRDAIPDEPFVQAADAIARALGTLRAALRADAIRAIEHAFAAEKSRLHLLGFDDLLARLRHALVREGADGPLARAIRQRWDAALIDEFQDTDAYQFDIFTRAFANRPLFLIGDPKQAIYGFRGADVHAYLDAAREADRRYTLATNWRSTARMIGAVNALFRHRPGAFLDADIDFVPATPARPPDDVLADDARVAALHWWFVPPGPEGEMLALGVGEKRLHAALAREVVRLATETAIVPGRIAVLVRTSYEGAAVERALRAAGVPSILAGMDDILASREMRELETVMRAVLASDDQRVVRAALATAMWGVDALEIHRLSQPEQEPEWTALLDMLGTARERWVRHGFMRMAQRTLADLGVVERLLAYEDGERRVTNLRHAVELLHSVSVEERLSPEGLLVWIARYRDRRREDAERRELRLESDADAVQIVTIHKSKGLEYDVVMCPGLWTAWRSDERPVLAREPEGVVLDHGSPLREARGRIADAEELAEALRLAYVALTRARLRCYVGWGAIENTRTRIGGAHSGIAWLLRDGDEGETREDRAEHVAESLLAQLGAWESKVRALVDASGGTMSVEVLDAVAEEVPRWSDVRVATTTTDARRYMGGAEQMATWRPTSFTRLTSVRRQESVAAEVTPGPADDELVKEEVEETARAARAVRRDDFLDFPKGADAGVALHELFERAPFAASDAALRTLAAEVLATHRLREGDEDPRIDAVAGMAARTLRATVPGAGFALADVDDARMLREWGFHLPLGLVRRETLAALFAEHGDALARRYAPALRTLAPRDVWGYLSGVVDLAFEHEGHWWIVDWKSNHLGYDPAAYDAAALEAEMIGSHYVLQYHLYVVALHRFLRHRVAGYDYETHVGGVAYAFLRGIDGGARGWFHDRPPRALVDALDRLMDDGAARLGGAA